MSDEADRRDAAMREIRRLIDGGKWRMTIPVKEDRDSDTILGAVVSDSKRLERERDEARAERDALATYALQIADAFNEAEEARPGIIEMTRELADLVSANLQNLATFGLDTEDDNE